MFYKKQISGKMILFWGRGGTNPGIGVRERGGLGVAVPRTYREQTVSLRTNREQNKNKP